MTETLNRLVHILSSGGIANAEREATQILSTAQSCGASAEQALAMAERRIAGTPLPYLTGH
jgi:hypothetical protein